jgi:hypothetical protein
VNQKSPALVENHFSAVSLARHRHQFVFHLAAPETRSGPRSTIKARVNVFCTGLGRYGAMTTGNVAGLSVG